MTLLRDHVAGATLLAAAGIALALSGDLPIGTLASPGPGMLPHLALGLIAMFAGTLLIGARSSPPMAETAWGDLPHAARVLLAASLAVAFYEPLGFVVTMGLMIFGLLAAIERAPPWRAAAFSLALTGGTWMLLAKFLKSPLPIGPWGF